MRSPGLLKLTAGVILSVFALMFGFGEFVMAQETRITAPVSAEEPAFVLVQAQTGLGTLEHEVGGVDVVLLEVKRASGDSLTLRWQLRNRTQENKELAKPTGSWSDAYRLSLDAYLIDPGNKKKYLVLKDEKGNPVAGKHEMKKGGINLAPGQTLNTWAKFPAPPANVGKISIYLPGVPPFEDIPISK